MVDDGFCGELLIRAFCYNLPRLYTLLISIVSVMPLLCSFARVQPAVA